MKFFEQPDYLKNRSADGYKEGISATVPIVIFFLHVLKYFCLSIRHLAIHTNLMPFHKTTIDFSHTIKPPIDTAKSSSRNFPHHHQIQLTPLTFTIKIFKTLPQHNNTNMIAPSSFPVAVIRRLCLVGGVK